MSLILFACLVTITIWPPATDQATIKDSAAFFAGTTPCSNIIRPLHKIPKESDCQLNECHCIMVEWKLALYKNAVSQEPTTYKLTGINRFSVKETNMYSQPGTKSETVGKWTIIKGTKTNPNAIVYRLNPDTPALSLSFLKLSDNLLHILDSDERLLIGNEFFSYTLNRVADLNQ